MLIHIKEILLKKLWKLYKNSTGIKEKLFWFKEYQKVIKAKITKNEQNNL